MITVFELPVNVIKTSILINFQKKIEKVSVENNAHTLINVQIDIISVYQRNNFSK